MTWATNPDTDLKHNGTTTLQEVLCLLSNILEQVKSVQYAYLEGCVVFLLLSFMVKYKLSTTTNSIQLLIFKFFYYGNS